ncbi:MAG: hypothetical protein H0W28_05870 [Pyrinomonadaceae bacterium]|nr:hypothetical protein [Pyrinomonadaceae bacterium]
MAVTFFQSAPAAAATVEEGAGMLKPLETAQPAAGSPSSELNNSPEQIRRSYEKLKKYRATAIRTDSHAGRLDELEPTARHGILTAFQQHRDAQQQRLCAVSQAVAGERVD